MSKKSNIKPLTIALGTAFAASMAASNVAIAAQGANPFAMNELPSGYMQVADKGTEGKCGGAKAKNEGQCGGKKDMDKAMEGKCGEGKKAEKEGKCGEDKKVKKEGKCGEGKCGGKK